MRTSWAGGASASTRCNLTAFGFVCVSDYNGRSTLVVCIAAVTSFSFIPSLPRPNPRLPKGLVIHGDSTDKRRLILRDKGQFGADCADKEKRGDMNLVRCVPCLKYRTSSTSWFLILHHLVSSSLSSPISILYIYFLSIPSSYILDVLRSNSSRR